ncbi:MAG: outer membrane lipoprotein chaperone LolA [Proteobacteria bacterium]|nr:outer membrane lipoprotein chaperone LolA [Pseudomonadota bacterium]
MKRLAIAVLLGAASFIAHADAVDTLRDFIRDVKTGEADFTQTVTSPDGAKKKTSSGHFEFARPNRFRFSYTKPFVQTIVADGEKVWIYDADLNQASSRKIASALGATPAALLAGGSLDKDFDLAALPSHDGLDWVSATPKAKDSTFKSVQVGFKGKDLAAVDIADAFGQHSLMQFSGFRGGVSLPAETFRYTPPAGADVIEQ